MDHRDTITFPAGAMKNGKAHQVPFGEMAHALLERLPQQGLLFPNRKREPFSSWPVGKCRFDALSGVTNYICHDCRRTFATLMAEVADPIIVGRFLTHNRILAGVPGIYSLFSYLDPMRDTMKKYENRLEALLSTTEGVNVRADLRDVHRIRA